MRDIYCDYCGRKCDYVDSSAIYGKSYGMIYICWPCDAYVGVHKGTDKPLGRLADSALRLWKRQAHDAFDPLWKYGRFRGRRNAAYAWLAEKMGLPIEETHIGMFDVQQCKQVIAICGKEKEYESNRSKADRLRR